MSLEKRLDANTEVKLMYCQFMREYLELEHMELADSSVIHNKNYFLPHHAVLRPESSV